MTTADIRARRSSTRAAATVEVDVILMSGASGTAAVPQGLDRCPQAVELRDGDPARTVKGVFRAVENVNDDRG